MILLLRPTWHLIGVVCDPWSKMSLIPEVSVESYPRLPLRCYVVRFVFLSSLPLLWEITDDNTNSSPPPPVFSSEIGTGEDLPLPPPKCCNCTLRDSQRDIQYIGGENENGRLACIDLRLEPPRYASRAEIWVSSWWSERVWLRCTGNYGRFELGLETTLVHPFFFLSLTKCSLEQITPKYLQNKYQTTFIKIDFFFYFVFHSLCFVFLAKQPEKRAFCAGPYLWACVHSNPGKSPLITLGKWLVRASAEQPPSAWPVVSGFGPRRKTG